MFKLAISVVNITYFFAILFLNFVFIEVELGQQEEGHEDCDSWFTCLTNSIDFYHHYKFEDKTITE